jgi:DNA mismatch repair ATPase MutS
LRKPRKRSLVERLSRSGPPSYGFTIAPRDEHGHHAASELRNRGINHVADAVAQSADHILDFFARLRAELGFYVGCLNLHEQLTERGEPVVFPEPLGVAPRMYTARGLYDAALAFHLDRPVVGNDVDADGKRLMIVTGANQGGKSTLLRSIGLAQLMMQAGMFVPAESFRARSAPASSRTSSARRTRP